ncbi:hypothetical protein VTK73DRAFT_9247 [Phialemonium thermophilum]|uniref:Uncharacterized protein n=1 Tax=Phialemonium thermophilum TaxID=223376 RepID=A0ABR3XLR3_9PEZI
MTMGECLSKMCDSDGGRQSSVVVPRKGKKSKNNEKNTNKKNARSKNTNRKDAEFQRHSTESGQTADT